MNQQEIISLIHGQYQDSNSDQESKQYRALKKSNPLSIQHYEIKYFEAIEEVEKEGKACTVVAILRQIGKGGLR